MKILVLESELRTNFDQTKKIIFYSYIKQNMPASHPKPKQPIILLVTPHQVDTKFLTQKHLPSINARIKVRRKQDEPPLELNATISNPFYKPVAGSGLTHNTPADVEMRDCIDDCRKTRNARVRALKAEQEGGRLIKSKKLTSRTSS